MWNKIKTGLGWTFRIVSIIMLAIPLILCTPGLILHILSEEIFESIK